MALLLSSIRARRLRARFESALRVQTALLLSLSAITMAAPFVFLIRVTRLESRRLSRRWQTPLLVGVVSVVVAPFEGANSLDSRTSSTVVVFSKIVSWVWPLPCVRLPSCEKSLPPTVYFFCWGRLTRRTLALVEVASLVVP